MIKELPAEKYNHVERPYFESCVGKHVRHLLDHYLCFQRDIDNGIIDYEQRTRNSQLETDKDHVLAVIDELIIFLRSLENIDDRAIKVALCSDVSFPEGEMTDSTIRRELQFLQGHTVHHYALIAMMLRFYGVDTSREFGMAPSTLVHEETVKASA
jgi:uncharacterized damage-inducible protein DinB